jgi:thymidylate synthase (methanogen type)
MRAVDEAAPAKLPARGLAFEAVHYRELLHVVNPRGDVGLVTLWSPIRTARRKLDDIAVELLDAKRSRIAVMSNLYGDGLFAMFANLHNNPQVRHIIAIGEDLGLPTCQEIEAFLSDGLEDVEMLGKPMKRIRGTERLFPVADGFDEALLRRRLTFRAFGKLSRPELPGDLLDHLRELPVVPTAQDEPRRRVMLPVVGPEQYSHRPSQVNAHQVVRARPLDCWQELVVRAMRFGRPVELRNGPRLELLNVKAVVTAPETETEEALARCGFSTDELRAYQERILTPELPGGIAYTYGNRLRGYFDQSIGGRDTLRSVIKRLRTDPETRRAYISLWDTTVDLEDAGDEEVAKPCMTTLYFRRSEGKLSLTATYRSHNLLSGWLLNAYGLMAIQRHVADAVGVPHGELTVVSHSLGIDPRSPRFGLAKSIEEEWDRDDDLDRDTGKWQLREDPCGYFVVSADPEQGKIVAEHRYGGVLIKRYEAERAVTIENEVSADMAISLVSHAMWLGRELTKNEQLLRASRKRG